jgi:hypothetical protein
VKPTTYEPFQDHGNGRRGIDSEEVVDVTHYVIRSSWILRWAGGRTNSGAGQWATERKAGVGGVLIQNLQDRTDSNLRPELRYLHVAQPVRKMLSSSPSISTCGLQSPFFL